MIRLTLLAVGKIRDPHLSALCREFVERLERYARFRLEEVRDSPAKTPELTMEREAQELSRRLVANSLCVAVDREGRSFTSEQLSRWLQERTNAGQSDFTFLIGGPAGLAPALRKQAGMALSLSAMTFTHEMARLILLEQLYRAMTIWRGEPYHRGG
ncbi:MAG: 23S rRNA (pseudouridine(1915)-N(3))-methyltransferase RlmH [Bradymonadales bacterium]|nr:23S rRNA (pseudouridine(1915)-N(3))-methyltransferase RlmH [Bradymonadales bacterium]